MKRVAGFSLIELLVVIAIIAILSAIIFPVFARAKASAYKNSDMASMNQLRTALQIYQNDQEGYPPALLGYVTLYSSGPDMGNVIPANKLHGFLYSDRVKAITPFQPSYNKNTFLTTTAAVYPHRDPRPIGSAPVRDLNGDGIEDSNDDTCGARQAFGPGDGMFMLGGGVTNDPNFAAYFYSVSGYDVAEVPDTPENGPPCGGAAYGGSVGTRFELRYTQFWSDFALNSNGNSADDPRQLGYTFPPDDTIITWNSYFRQLDPNEEPKIGNNEVVLFVGGSAKAFSSRDMYDRSWRVQVNP